MGKEGRMLVVLDVGLAASITGKTKQEVFAGGAILAFTPDGKFVRTILQRADFVLLPDGIVYDEKTERLYYTNMGTPPLNDGSVCSVGLDGSSPKIILRKGQVHTPKQLALDTQKNQLYIANREGMRVVRCDTDGSNFEILVQNGDFRKAEDVEDLTKWCVGMAISQKNRLFYWTQKGPPKSGKGRIFCSHMDAVTEAIPFCVLDNLPEPIDLEVDDETGTLFWTDRGELPYGNTFNKAKLDATGTRLANTSKDEVTGLDYQILTQHFDEAIGLVYDSSGHRWFVSDMGGNIWAFDKEGGTKTKVLEDQNRAFTGITMVKI